MSTSHRPVLLLEVVRVPRWMDDVKADFKAAGQLPVFAHDSDQTVDGLCVADHFDLRKCACTTPFRRTC